jgi:hypothetical protein
MVKTRHFAMGSNSSCTSFKCNCLISVLRWPAYFMMHIMSCMRHTGWLLAFVYQANASFEILLQRIWWLVWAEEVARVSCDPTASFAANRKWFVWEGKKLFPWRTDLITRLRRWGIGDLFLGKCSPWPSLVTSYGMKFYQAPNRPEHLHRRSQ